jgi:hypothetical protein
MRDLLGKTLAARVPLPAVLGLCALCVYGGGALARTAPNGKYLVADKNAVILGAVLERNSTDVDTLKAEITQPVLQILRRYTEQGYVVIDGARDEHGNLTIAALPPGTRDITGELAAAVARGEHPR